MKRVLMSAFMMGALVAAKAQKNTVLVGGNIAIESTKVPDISGDTKKTTFEFSPTIGYQFNNNWTAGIVATASAQKTTYTSTEQKLNLFQAGPFIRYAKPLSSMFALYGQLEGQFGGGKNTNTSGSNSTSSKYTTANINLFPALFIDFKNSFGLNFNIGGISYTSVKPKGSDASSTFNFNFGKTASIGVSKNFGGKK